MADKLTDKQRDLLIHCSRSGGGNSGIFVGGGAIAAGLVRRGLLKSDGFTRYFTTEKGREVLAQMRDAAPADRSARRAAKPQSGFDPKDESAVTAESGQAPGGHGSNHEGEQPPAHDQFRRSP